MDTAQDNDTIKAYEPSGSHYDYVKDDDLMVADYRRKPREYLFIDDSGDAGLSTSNTDYLIFAAVIVVDEDSKDVLEEAINSFRRSLGWNELDEFKFAKTNKNTLAELINSIKAFEFKAYVVVFDKREVDLSYTVKENISIYEYVLKELLIRVGKNNQFITIDGTTGKKYEKETRTYLRQALRENGIMNTNIRFVDSRKEPLVQLADIIAGAIACSYKDKPDAKRFLKMLEGKLIKTDKIKL